MLHNTPYVPYGGGGGAYASPGGYGSSLSVSGDEGSDSDGGGATRPPPPSAAPSVESLAAMVREMGELDTEIGALRTRARDLNERKASLEEDILALMKSGNIDVVKHLGRTLRVAESKRTLPLNKESMAQLITKNPAFASKFGRDARGAAEELASFVYANREVSVQEKLSKRKGG